VGTEIYDDFLRLLYARGADAYSYNTGRENGIVPDEQIKDLIIQDFSNKRTYPLLFGLERALWRLFQQIAKQGS
jgi:excinuclease ABC subunit A